MSVLIAVYVLICNERKMKKKEGKIIEENLNKIRSLKKNQEQISKNSK